MSNIATETKIVHDDNLGIDRQVIAGTEIPPDLRDAYENAGGGTTDQEPGQPGETIATEDRVVHDEQLGIDRKIVAGQPVPPDLVDAYEAAGGKTEEAPKPKRRSRAAQATDAAADKSDDADK